MVQFYPDMGRRKTAPEIDFPAMIKAVRNSLGESQVEFAKRFNTGGNTVSRWESGQYYAPYNVLSFVLRRHEREIVCPVCKGRGKI